MNNTTAQTTQRNWQEIIDNLFRFSEIERDKPLNFYHTFLETAESLQALEQNNGTEAEKEAFFKEVQKIYSYFEKQEQSIRENRQLEQQFKDYSKLGINFDDLINKQDEQLKQIARLKDQLKKAENLSRIPKTPLTTLAGLETLLTNSKAESLEINKQEAAFYFSVNLQIAEQIPFIYNCIRERANDGLELNAGIETLIELHKAYNRHISEQFSQLENIIFDEGDLC
ncbi:hypothetical protein PTQ27_01265 [Mannheimia sp. AT1]|uniref:Uncharacterized protein n=1 Tax=Mannheimia cairinae TaxID=3025936 RepID=A0ABT5MQI2_9PAST|nr:hypothetical protein [Mannheimia cairinae]MDD0823103.1 hypothetical protein [Mannheimia cairinae]MDD0825872.1 hypothetical protein [Mannheimia cairinae]